MVDERVEAEVVLGGGRLTPGVVRVGDSVTACRWRSSTSSSRQSVTPVEDVGYMAWSWCISSKPARGLPAEQARQVGVLADAYGISAGLRRRLPAAIEDRFVRNERFWRERADAGRPPQAGLTAAEALAWTRQEAAHFAANRSVFAAALS